MSAWNPALVNINPATIIPPQMAAIAIKKSKNPLLVIGSLINELPLEIAENSLRIAEKKNITIASTGGASVTLTKLGHKTHNIGLVELINHLKNPEWKGFEGKGNYDLVCFIGAPYYLGSQGLSTLKNFAPHIKTLTLCRFMHPHADVTFPNLNYEEWVNYLQKLNKELNY